MKNLGPEEMHVLSQNIARRFLTHLEMLNCDRMGGEDVNVQPFQNVSHWRPHVETVLG